LVRGESIGELFANIDINSFINDYNLGISNHNLKIKYNIRSPTSLQNFIISLAKERKIKFRKKMETHKETKEIKYNLIKDNKKNFSNKDTKQITEIQSKYEVEKLERETIDDLEIELMLEEYNRSSKINDNNLELFDKKNDNKYTSNLTNKEKGNLLKYWNMDYLTFTSPTYLISKQITFKN
jgi:hypothetical protein